MKWAVVGELIFALESDGNIVPAQIIEVKNINNVDYYVYNALDNSKIEHNQCECKLAGFKGGKIFKSVKNAKEYYNQIKNEGKFNMTYALMNSLRENKGYSNTSIARSSRSIREQQNIDNNYNYLQAVIISAMLLAINEVKGIGPMAAEMIVEKYGDIVTNNKYKDIIEKVQKKFSIDLELGDSDDT